MKRSVLSKKSNFRYDILVISIFLFGNTCQVIDIWANCPVYHGPLPTTLPPMLSLFLASFLHQARRIYYQSLGHLVPCFHISEQIYEQKNNLFVLHHCVAKLCISIPPELLFCTFDVVWKNKLFRGL